MVHDSPEHGTPEHGTPDHGTPEHGPPVHSPADPAPVRRARLSGSVRLPPGCETALFLFTPRGEKLWADGWDPQFPAPAEDDTEPGTVFETAHGPQRTTWVVCAREPGRSVRYARVVHGQNAGTVTVTLDDAGTATVEYDLTALVRRGRGRPGPVRRALCPVPAALGAGHRGRHQHPVILTTRNITTPEREPLVPDAAPHLFTIGHSNQPLDDFLGLLQQHGIEVIADVRTVPWSRYVPHFNAKALGAALAQRTIEYVPFGRELGGRPEGDEFYDDQGHVHYGRLAASPAFQDGLDRILAQARTSRIALLCSEEDPRRCHRHLLIGRVLGERGVPVSHLRRDGGIETGADLAASEPGEVTQATLFDDDPQWRSPRPISGKVPRSGA